MYFHNGTGKWAVEIKINNQKNYLGLFDTKEEAIKAREQAEIDYYGEYRRKS